MTLADLLGGLPDVAVHTLDTTVSSTELADAADSLGATLAGLGVETGQVVAAMLPNDATTVAALFGTWRAGGVYTPLNPRAADAELVTQFEILDPVAVITTPDLAHRFGAFDGLHVVTGAGMQWSARRSKLSGDHRHFGDDVALLQFTSGTTGPPKPVPLRHATVLDLIDRLLEKLRGAKTSNLKRTPMPNLVPLSLSLWAGIYQVLFAFRAGSGVVLMDRFAPADFAALVARHQLRSTVLPPAALTMVLHDETVTSLDPLRIVRSITAPLSPVQARPVSGQIRCARAEFVWPDRVGRRGRRVVGRRRARVRRGQARLGRADLCRASTWR